MAKEKDLTGNSTISRNQCLVVWQSWYVFVINDAVCC